MKWFRSGLFYTVVWLVTPYYAIRSSIAYYVDFLRGGKTPSNASHEVSTKWAKTIMRFTPGWKINIEGRENIPKSGKACVLVANHESAIDILVIYYLGIQFRWLAKKEIFKVPLIGWSMKLAGHIPIDRTIKDSHHQAFLKCEELLSSGTPVFFFPEGTRSKTGKIKKFKRGAFKLANDCSTSVLPICIKGAGNLLLKGTMSPNSGIVIVKILPEVDIEKVS